MPVGLLTLEIELPDAHSLKDKRQVLRSLKDRMKHRFNVAVAELDHHDLWQSSTIGIVTISNSAAHATQQLETVLADAERLLERCIVSHEIEIL